MDSILPACSVLGYFFAITVSLLKVNEHNKTYIFTKLDARFRVGGIPAMKHFPEEE